MAFFGTSRAFMPMLQAAMSGQIPGVIVEDPEAIAQALGIPSPGAYGGPPATAANTVAPGAFGNPATDLEPIKVSYGGGGNPVTDGVVEQAPPTPSSLPPLSSGPLAIPDYMRGIDNALARNQAMALPPVASPMPNPKKKPSKIGQFLGAFAGHLGDNLSGNPVYANHLQHKRRMEEARQEAELRAQMPQQVGSTIVVPNGMGGYEMLYRAPSTAEDYALAQGFEAGTPEYAEAVRQYRLGSWNDEAMEARTGLTGYRYDRQGQLQEDRQDFSRGMQEDRQSHSNSQLRSRLNAPPRYKPTQPRQPSPSAVIGRIMNKQARGETLTPAERQTLDEYRAPKGKPRRGGAPVRVNSLEEARRLPPGTVFITPDGRVKVR